jgi:hypothetical protein
MITTTNSRPIILKTVFSSQKYLQVFNLGVYFYTRNIAQPQFAYKLTGNSGRINWGILGALDKEIRDEGVLINRADIIRQSVSIPPGKSSISAIL